LSKNESVPLDRHDLVDGLTGLPDTAAKVAFQKRRCLLDTNIPRNQMRRLRLLVTQMASREHLEVTPWLPTRDMPKELPDSYILDYLWQDMVGSYPVTNGPELQSLLNPFFELNIRLMNSGIDISFFTLPRWVIDAN